jgi:DMSO/TMAO reductase YedYZ molybdopterin-dependent catalytic subunit
MLAKRDPKHDPGRGPERHPSSRRRWLRGAVATAGAALLAGCDRLSNNAAFVDVLGSAERLNHGAQRLLAGHEALAQEFPPSAISPSFRGNGTLVPADADYQAWLADGFAQWKLRVGGLVEAPAAFSLADLRAMPSRTQITRHDCVEGWSCIGQWQGVQLRHVLEQVRPRAQAKYVLFRCADSMEEPSPGAPDTRYYESIGMDDAVHVQTLLAYALNGKPLPVANGAPLRLRVERQLGYKHAKYLVALELVESLAAIRGGRGGYWEDNGYEWYAGI